MTVEDICKCTLSAEHGILYCDRNRNDTIILHARIIITESRGNISLLSTLQQWVHRSPTLVARGVKLRVMAECSVYLAELNSTSSIGCVRIPKASKTTQQPTAPQPTPKLPTNSESDNGDMESKKSTSAPIPAIAGTIVAIVVVIIIVILAVLVCRKWRSKRTIRFTG